MEGVVVEVGVAAALFVCVEVGVILQVFAHLPHLRSDGLARFDAGAMFQRHHNAYQGVFAFLGPRCRLPLRDDCRTSSCLLDRLTLFSRFSGVTRDTLACRAVGLGHGVCLLCRQRCVLD